MELQVGRKSTDKEQGAGREQEQGPSADTYESVMGFVRSPSLTCSEAKKSRTGFNWLGELRSKGDAEHTQIRTHTRSARTCAEPSAQMPQRPLLAACGAAARGARSSLDLALLEGLRMRRRIVWLSLTPTRSLRSIAGHWHALHRTLHRSARRLVGAARTERREADS